MILLLAVLQRNQLILNSHAVQDDYFNHSDFFKHFLKSYLNCLPAPDNSKDLKNCILIAISRASFCRGSIRFILFYYFKPFIIGKVWFPKKFKDFSQSIIKYNFRLFRSETHKITLNVKANRARCQRECSFQFCHLSEKVISNFCDFNLLLNTRDV